MTRYLGPDDVFRFRDVSDPQLSPDGRRVAFVVAQPDAERDRDVGHVWVVPTDGGEPVQWTFGDTGERSPRWSPDGRRLAFLAARGEPGRAQVFVMDAAGGEARRLTSLPNGVAALAWSPTGDRIACVAVTKPAAETEAEKARPLVVRRLLFKADGQGLMGEARAHLFVVDAGGDGPAPEPVQLTEGDFFAQAPAWSPDGSEIAFVAARHEDRDLDLASHVFVVPSSGGPVRQVTRGAGTAGQPLWTGDGRIVFVGAPSALHLQASLWAVPAAGGDATHLLDGFDRTVMPGGGAAYPGAKPQLRDGRAITFCARIAGCVHVLEVGLDGGAPVRRLGDDDAVVSGMSIAGDTLVVALGTSGHPPELALVDGGGDVRALTAFNRELLAEVTVARPERRTFTAADGTSFEAFLYQPPGRQGPAPLLMDIHGGPHNAIGPFLWPAHLHWQELVGRGWCVVAPNPRGSDGYGLAFKQGVRGGWGVNDMQDFTAVVDGLVAEGVADPARLAVTGYSYGGFMTSWLVGHTNRFRRAVAGGVVSDLVSSFGTSDLGAYLGDIAVEADLHEAWDAYEERSPIRSAGSIETPLLILHGEADDRCDIGQAELLFAVLRRRGRDVELVRYPGASHVFIVTGRPSHRADYQRRVVDWVTRGENLDDR